jgi:hypothetical protein
VIAWLLLTLALALNEAEKESSEGGGGGGASGYLQLPRMLGVAVGFCLFLAFLYSRFLARFVVKGFNRKGRLTGNMLALVLVSLLVSGE